MILDDLANLCKNNGIRRGDFKVGSEFLVLNYLLMKSWQCREPKFVRVHGVSAFSCQNPAKKET